MPQSIPCLYLSLRLVVKWQIDELSRGQQREIRWHGGLRDSKFEGEARRRRRRSSRRNWQSLRSTGRPLRKWGGMSRSWAVAWRRRELQETRASEWQGGNERKRCGGQRNTREYRPLEDERTEGKELQTNYHFFLYFMVDFCVSFHGEGCRCFILLPTQHFWSHFAVK